MAEFETPYQLGRQWGRTSRMAGLDSSPPSDHYVAQQFKGHVVKLTFENIQRYRCGYCDGWDSLDKEYKGL